MSILVMASIYMGQHGTSIRRRDNILCDDSRIYGRAEGGLQTAVGRGRGQPSGAAAAVYSGGGDVRYEIVEAIQSTEVLVLCLLLSTERKRFCESGVRALRWLT